MKFCPVPSHLPAPIEVCFVQDSSPAHTSKVQSFFRGSQPSRALARELLPAPVGPTNTILGFGKSGATGLWPWIEQSNVKITTQSSAAPWNMVSRTGASCFRKPLSVRLVCTTHTTCTTCHVDKPYLGVRFVLHAEVLHFVTEKRLWEHLYFVVFEIQL